MYLALLIPSVAAQTLALSNNNQHHASAYRPISYNIGAATPEEADNFQPYRIGSGLTLTSSSPVLSLDYSAEVAGFPYVTVQLSKGPTQLELKYSEPYDGLALPYSDGPL